VVVRAAVIAGVVVIAPQSRSQTIAQFGTVLQPGVRRTAESLKDL
jgi:hypothetical protein